MLLEAKKNEMDEKDRKRREVLIEFLRGKSYQGFLDDAAATTGKNQGVTAEKGVSSGEDQDRFGEK